MLGTFINTTFSRHISEAKISYSKGVLSLLQLKSDQSIIEKLRHVVYEEEGSRNPSHKPLLFNEILSTVKTLYRTVCTQRMKIPIKQARYLIASCRYYLKGSHLNLLSALMKNGEKNITFVKRVITYPEFRDWITMRAYISSYYNHILLTTNGYKDYRDEEFRAIFELEIQRATI